MKFTDQAVYLWQGALDMRVSFDRLSSFVQEKMSQRVMSGGVYVFFSRCRSKVKILYWDKDGYVLWYKRLEAGSFKIERGENHEQVSAVDLELLLSGVDFSRIKLQKNTQKGSFN